VPSVETRILRDGTHRYFVRLRDPKRGKFTSETFASKAEAEQFCRVVAAVGPAEAIARRDAAIGRGAPETVDDLAEPFFRWKLTGPHKVRSDRTVADYRRDYCNWIKPTFGSRQAEAVTEDDVRQWVDAMGAGTLGRPPASAKSIADRHSILYGIYAWAVREKRIVTNPCIGTHLPKRRKTAPKAIRPAEWEAIWRALVQIDPDAADLAVFLLSSGWRFSEGAALSGFDVEDYGDRLWVTMGRVIRRNAAGQHVIVEDAKSEAGQRRIELGPTVADIVRRIGHEHLDTTYAVYGSMIQDVSPVALTALDKMIGGVPQIEG
jgi:integrase